MLLLLAAPGIELRFIKTELAGSSSDANALSQFQGFIADSGVCCLRGFLLVDVDFVMSHLWLRVYSLNRVSTIAG
ncbi:hypothetical protein AU511_16560 [Lonsdalea iberica]|uniref:Uncharacterized protein n=1 Tax=Lonsdalea iberica TaxID=1082703 RepID=A0A1X3RII8_9GAMM|nr:hypothetical protein AU511_16560 [Lonsdalea iberica]